MLLLLATLALASPFSKSDPNIPTTLRNGMDLPFFYPPSFTKSFQENPFEKRDLGTSDSVAFGRQELLKELGLKDEDLLTKQAHTDSFGVTHVYCQRAVGGVPVLNQNAAIHLSHGRIISLTSSFSNTNPKIASRSGINSQQAISIAENQFGIKLLINVLPKEVYLQIPNGDLVHAHQFQLRNLVMMKWFSVSVESQTGMVIQVIDFASRSGYTAVQFPKYSPADGFDQLVNPQFLPSSPLGWHNNGMQTFTSTKGNNVDSHGTDATHDFSDPNNLLRVEGGPELLFQTHPDPNAEPTTVANNQAAIVNAFYGFKEDSGNFQDNNFGKGGKDSDHLDVQVHFGDMKNNAVMYTPEDGVSPFMRLYTWNVNSSPERDGSFDTQVLTHEYFHGVSNRLTGGGFTGGCLQTPVAGGMGEGWSDMAAIILTRTRSDNSKAPAYIGAYSVNNIKGIRSLPYSTLMEVNPRTFSWTRTQSEVHAVGEYWALVLFEVYWSLVDKLGFSPDIYNSMQMAGNIITLQLIMGGLKLQPCNPNFMDARDAIISADMVRYGGVHTCQIWRAFAKRGMGTDAVFEGRIDGFMVPRLCTLRSQQ